MEELIDYHNLKYLIGRIKNCNDEKAFVAFHKRFQPFIKKVLFYKKYHYNLKRYYKSGLEPQDLIQDIFLKFITLLPNFDISEKTEIESEKIIFSWLGGIANNIILKTGTEFNSENYRVDFVLEETKEVLINRLVENVYIEENQTVDIKRIEYLLENYFTEREREILFTYANENCLNSERRLHPNKLEELALRHETSKANIKQINHRSFKKLGNLLNSG
jgi:RNA polymerase sigma factor (sigma-70 family)